MEGDRRGAEAAVDLQAGGMTEADLGHMIEKIDDTMKDATKAVPGHQQAGGATITIAMEVVAVVVGGVETLL